VSSRLDRDARVLLDHSAIGFDPTARGRQFVPFVVRDVRSQVRRAASSRRPGAAVWYPDARQFVADEARPSPPPHERE